MDILETLIGKSNNFLLGLALLIVVTALAISSALSSTESSNLDSMMSEKSNYTTLVDCRNQTHTCEESVITERPKECHDNWVNWKPYSELNCTYTSNNLDSVSFVADAANYITAPRTEVDYETEFVTFTGNSPWDLEFLPSGKPIWTTKELGEVRYLENKSIPEGISYPVLTQNKENAIKTNEDSERKGWYSSYVPERKHTENKSIMTIADLDTDFTGTVGMLGLAVDPDFSNNKHVYVFYTYREAELTELVNESKVDLKDFDDDPSTEEGRERFYNRISRFKVTKQGLINETVLLEDIPSSDHHSGGRIEFGPDDKLYATTADGNLLHKAASKESLAGKTLRLNKDGSIPEDNPSKDSYVYTRAHANSIGLAWHPETNDLYGTEHGTWRYDEVNKLEPGKNYGWYGYQCGEKNDVMHGEYERYYEGTSEKYFNNTPPAHCFRNWTIAPGGATFVDEPGHPWYGDMFIAGLRSKQVYRLKFENGKPVEGEVFYTSHNEPRIHLRLRDVEFREGSLYVIGDDEGLVKITPTDYQS